MTVSSFTTNLQARHHGMLSERAFQASAKVLIPEINLEYEKMDPSIFLTYLRGAVGETVYDSLINRVTFGEKLSLSLLVKRLIVREYIFLKELSNHTQNVCWCQNITPFLASGKPPESMSVKAYLAIRTWTQPPFARLPVVILSYAPSISLESDILDYPQRSETDDGVMQRLYQVVDEAVRSVVEEA